MIADCTAVRHLQLHLQRVSPPSVSAAMLDSAQGCISQWLSW